MTNPDTAGDRRELVAGDEVELEMGPAAHGGSCVARADGRVVFVRYALPGERALVRITEAKRGSFCRGEAIEILRADGDRVEAPCRHFGPRRPDGSGGCGGCDWMHARPELQRELKAGVIAEQFQRLAGIDVAVAVQPLHSGGSTGTPASDDPTGTPASDDPDGTQWGWRTKVRWAIDQERGGTVGPRRYRSHRSVAITAAEPCLIADPQLSGAATEALVAAPDSTDEIALGVDGRGQLVTPVYLSRGRSRARRHPDAVVQVADGRDFRIAADGFWQAHRHAADTFCRVVREMLAAHGGSDLVGGVAWDLYGGAGLFAPVLAQAVGARGRVVTVEGNRAASRHAQGNLADLRQVRVRCDRVDRFVRQPDEDPDVVLLDPPRSGAGLQVCRGVAARQPGLIIYVACDPAALARDTATLLADGYRLVDVRAFDAFPNTHHLECIAAFRR